MFVCTEIEGSLFGFLVEGFFLGVWGEVCVKKVFYLNEVVWVFCIKDKLGMNIIF